MVRCISEVPVLNRLILSPPPPSRPPPPHKKEVRDLDYYAMRIPNSKFNRIRMFKKEHIKQIIITKLRTVKFHQVNIDRFQVDSREIKDQEKK